MKTLLIISVLFIISCRPIQVTVECPHKESYAGPGIWHHPGFEFPQENEYLPYYEPQGPGYLYIDGQKIPIDSILSLDSEMPLIYTWPDDKDMIRFIPD